MVEAITVGQQRQAVAHRANSEEAAAAGAADERVGQRMKNIVTTTVTPSTAFQLDGDRPVERPDRLVEIHDLDDAQIVERADDAGEHADHGEPDQIGVDRGEEDVELAEEPGERRDAGQREHEDRRAPAASPGWVRGRPARSAIPSTIRPCRRMHRMTAKVPRFMKR